MLNRILGALSAFLSRLNPFGWPILGQLLKTLERLVESRRGVLTVASLIMIMLLALVPTAHEVAPELSILIVLVVAVTVGGFTVTDGLAIGRAGADDVANADLADVDPRGAGSHAKGDACGDRFAR